MSYENDDTGFNAADSMDSMSTYEMGRLRQELKKQTEIEEERLMLEKAKAMKDMSVYENYLKEREIRRAEEAKSKNKTLAAAYVFSALMMYLFAYYTVKIRAHGYTVIILSFAVILTGMAIYYMIGCFGKK